MRNKHHVLFPKSIHEATEIGSELRSQRLLIPTMDANIHTDLHRNIAFVPPLNHFMGQRVLYLMRGSDANNSIQAMKDYMDAVEDSMDHPKVNYMDRALGRVVIESINEQIPFIQNSNRLLREIDSRRPQRGTRR